VERFVIDMYGPEEEAERDAFRWLLAKATELRTAAAVIVPGVQNIDGLNRVLGDHAERAKQRRELMIGEVQVHFYTPKTQPGRFDGPVLVMWADTGMVEAAERLGPPAICATGWTEDGLDGWKRSWAPIDPRTGEAVGEAAELPPLVRGAIESLSGIANDVLHPMDRRRAINAFKALRMHGIPYDPAIVRSTAITIGWRPDAAERLMKIAQGIADGRALRGGDRLTQAQAKRLLALFESTDDSQ
jgi:hypothetical protein